MDKLDIYAKVILRSGINIRKGQCLRINCGASNYDFARIIGQEAYDMGALYVHINIMDNHLRLNRLKNQSGDDLDFVPQFMADFGKEMLKDDWAVLRIDNTEEIGVLKSADPEKLSLG